MRPSPQFLSGLRRFISCPCLWMAAGNLGAQRPNLRAVQSLHSASTLLTTGAFGESHLQTRDGLGQNGPLRQFVAVILMVRKGMGTISWRYEETGMANRLDQILVIDVESTCWEGDPPPGQESEIIEIGLCTLDVGRGERLESTSILVRPERSFVSPCCTALTTLTQQDIEEGLSLHEACTLLQEGHRSKKRLWASYGDYDRRQFERNCTARAIDYPFGPGHINVKSLFAVVRGMPREVSLAKAMKIRGWPLEGTYHRGNDDAWNIARILGDILLRARRR